jgi:hypothetical protein
MIQRGIHDQEMTLRSQAAQGLIQCDNIVGGIVEGGIEDCHIKLPVRKGQVVHLSLKTRERLLEGDPTMFGSS